MLLFKKIEPTLLIDGKNIEKEINALEGLKNLNEDGEKLKQKDLKLLKIGLIGEKQILFELLHSNIPMYIFHDVYYEFEDKNAQIDFVVITEYKIFIIECKNIIGNVILNSDSSFVREFNNMKEGMYSPITQNQRHIDLLVNLILSKHNIIERLIKGNVNDLFESIVVFTNPKTIIKNKFASKNIKDKVIRADAIISHIKSIISKSNKKVIDIESYARFFEFNNSTMNKDYISKYDKFLIENKTSNNYDIIKTKLIDYRKLKSVEEGAKPYFIFTNEQMENIVCNLPRSLDQLKNIRGFGDYKVNKYGNDIIKIINEFKN